MQQPNFGGVSFNCGPRYQLIKLLGAGAYGNVVMAYDNQNKGRKLGIKKLNQIDDVIDAKRILREIKIQKTMDHPNILKLYEVYYDRVPNQEFGDIYLVTQFYPSDLQKIIKSGQELTPDHVQYIMYQLCKGLHYIHSANIIHRDIKPGNILADENCGVCYCDFGFARQFDETLNFNEDHPMTEYVVTRQYRAPEIMLSSQQYTKSVDIWALGCTFAELLTGKILFRGQNYIHMIKLFFDILGKPSEEELKAFTTNENALSFIETLPNKPKQKVSKTIGYPNKNALDLLDKMIVLNPQQRITIEQCLEHPYFSEIAQKNEEVTFNQKLECDFENDENITLNQLKRLILKEIEVNVEEEMTRIEKIQLENKQRLKAKKN